MQNSNMKNNKNSIRNIVSISSRSTSKQESFMPEYRRITPHTRNNSIQNEDSVKKSLLPSLSRNSHSRNYINISNNNEIKVELTRNSESVTKINLMQLIK